MRCTISTPRPSFTARSAFRSARATAIRPLGHAEPHRPASRLLHRAADGRRSGGYRAARAAVLFVRRVQPRFSRARRGALHAGAGRPRRAPTRSVPRRRHRRFRALRFRARGKAPRRHAVKVAFSLAFARDPAAPDIGFFTCQHRFPENFWNPAFQRHPNTATGVAGVVLVADNPTDHHIFLAPSPASARSRRHRAGSA